MKIAILTHKPRPIDIDKLFAVIKLHEPDTLIVDVPLEDCKKLGRYIKKYKLKEFDSVLLDIPFKRLYKQARQVNKLKKAWIYEEDAYQDFLPHSKWYKKFSKFYKKLKYSSIVSTGYFVTQKLRQKGFDCHFLPKGFNAENLYQLSDRERGIKLGFIGSLRSNVYSERKEALEFFAAEKSLQCFRTKGVEEYRNKLNEIETFVSADIGMGEYMCKNFEAMACGCVLLAYRQGNGEEEALGLKDMENVVLYSSFDEAVEKIALLEADPDKKSQIAEAGEKHVLSTVEYKRLGEKLLGLIRKG